MPVASLYIENSLLVTLDLSGNKITRLEYSILYQHEKLENLKLGFNQIKQIDINGKINKHNTGQQLHSDSAWKDTKNLKYL